MGSGGIAIVRLSGSDALRIGLELCQNRTSLTSHLMTYVTVIHPPSGKPIDQGYVVYFKAPRSFTGEDIVEFHLHGSMISVQQVLDAIQGLGGRLATAGEFSKRAFMNGKLSVSQAESIIELIESKNEKAHQVALDRYQGKLHEWVTRVRQRVLLMIEQIEGSIDFPDEVPPIDHTAVTQDIQELQAQLQNVLNTQDYGRLIQSGVHCVIVGKPNTGKSSMFNALVGEQKAIITNIAGTTRDFLEATVSYQNIHINLVDTAGYRQSDDPIERLGIEKMKEWIDRADCVLWVLDQTVPYDSDDEKVFEAIRGHHNVCICQNKVDQSDNLRAPDHVKQLISVNCSALTQRGLNAVLQHVYESSVRLLDVSQNDFICNMRQIKCIQDAKAAIDAMYATRLNECPDDLLVIDGRRAVMCLSELTGDELNEEILDGIFNRFCVGK